MLTTRTWPTIALVVACVLLQAEVPVAASISEELETCYNKDWSFHPVVLSEFLNSRPNRVRLYRTYRNVNESLKNSLTIVSALSLSRLNSLKAQCQSWPGPLAASVFIVLRQEPNSTELTPNNTAVLKEADSEVQAFVDGLHGFGVCQLFIMLLYEVVGDVFMEALLPINLLRNAALLPAQTPLVAMVDVDLLISGSAAEEVLHPESARKLIKDCADRKVFIIPAFETYRKLEMAEALKLAEMATQSGKRLLKPYLQTGKIQTFAEETYPKGHNCTNFTKWQQTTEPFAVQYTVNCEPWYIIDRLLNPPYDVRFRGYGWNKVAHAALLNSTNFSFVVDAQAFLVHRPHPKSEAQLVYSAAYKGGQKPYEAKLYHRKVAALRHTTLRDVKIGKYHPYADPQFKNCVQKLSWWKSYHVQYV